MSQMCFQITPRPGEYGTPITLSMPSDYVSGTAISIFVGGAGGAGGWQSRRGSPQDGAGGSGGVGYVTLAGSNLAGPTTITFGAPGVSYQGHDGGNGGDTIVALGDGTMLTVGGGKGGQAGVNGGTNGAGGTAGSNGIEPSLVGSSGENPPPYPPSYNCTPAGGGGSRTGQPGQPGSVIVVYQSTLAPVVTS